MLAALSTVGAALLAVLVLNAGGDVLDVRRNQVVPRAITARVELRIVDERRTEQMRLRARDRSPNFYKLDVSSILL